MLRIKVATFKHALADDVLDERWVDATDEAMDAHYALMSSEHGSAIAVTFTGLERDGVEVDLTKLGESWPTT